MTRKLIVALMAMLMVGTAVPAGAEPGVAKGEYEYGFFYGTFNEDNNVTLLAGGTAADFCDARTDEHPDPFGVATNSAPLRTFERQDGSIELKVNANHQPIHLYKTGPVSDGPAWINGICADVDDGGSAPAPDASGYARLKVRDNFLFENGPPTNLFNLVSGKVTSPDGTRYRVVASANIPFENGAPVGIPPDWVSIHVREIGPRKAWH